MNIAIDIRPLMERRYTGVSLYTYNLLKNLLELDSKNQYYLFYNSKSDVSANIPKFKKTNVHYAEFKYPNKLLNFSFKFLRWPKADLMINEKFKTSIDIFLMPNWQFISLSKHCKKILIVHDLSCSIYPEFYSLKRRLWHKIINTKKLCREFDQIITVSENTKKDLINLYKISPEKIFVIYPGVSGITDKVVELTTVKSKYGLPEKFILYLGALEPRKNISGIIEAFEKLSALPHGGDKPAFTPQAGRLQQGERVSSYNTKPDLKNLKLVLAGPKSWLYRGIKKSIDQSPVRENIRIIDYVREEDKKALYYLAEIFIYPSFYEGFGFPPLEAMAVGTPVVASFNSSLGEILGNSALLADPYNVAEIAHAMEQIILDKNLKKSLIKKGFKRAREFSWRKTAEKVLEIFNNF